MIYKVACAAWLHGQTYLETLFSQEKNGSNQSFDFIKDFKSSVKSLCD